MKNTIFLVILCVTMMTSKQANAQIATLRLDGTVLIFMWEDGTLSSFPNPCHMMESYSYRPIQFDESIEVVVNDCCGGSETVTLQSYSSDVYEWTQQSLRKRVNFETGVEEALYTEMLTMQVMFVLTDDDRVVMIVPTPEAFTASGDYPQMILLQLTDSGGINAAQFMLPYAKFRVGTIYGLYTSSVPDK